ncbi:AAA family ATPase [Paenibacillus sp. NPDC093718]|uniref:AAA family ATPase n=1 Tax=Paenibacillus sp. NPDC093718 TaxID=3390601 RepID=UPI003D0562C2
MNYLIKDLILEDSICSNYEIYGQSENELEHLSKINLFVGANNSGKSRFIRNLFLQSPYVFKPYCTETIKSLNILINNYKTELNYLINQYHISDYGGIIEGSQKIDSVENIIENDRYIKDFVQNINNSIYMKSDQPVTHNRGGWTTSYDTKKIATEINEFGSEYKEKLEKIIGDVPDVFNFRKVYIPTLRGLRPFSDETDYYSKRTVKDYFPNLHNTDTVFTGLEMYKKVRDLLLGNLEEREKIADFQIFLGETFFDGQEVALIPAINSDVLNVKIGKEKERPIYSLGDGIQSIIILTFPLFINKNENLLVFIEEPELYMHPGLQRKLIETFMGFKNFQYFITTHSNHFLDLTLDIEQISIYKFRKHFNSEESSQREVTANFIVENTSNEDKSILEMIGVRNSSIFLANCTIWVEGITDRYYLRHYLGLYMKSLQTDYKEDLHYSFVEYSGGNITHWSFLDDDTVSNDQKYRTMNVDRICNRLFLITDKDSEQKLERQKKLKKRLGKNYFCLPVREIENLVSKEVLLKVLTEYEKKGIDELKFRRNVVEADYKDEYLGSFIENNLLNKKRKGAYSAPSGTISDKLAFCRKVISHTHKLEDLSADAIKAVKKIYNFIVDSNK